MKQAHLIMTLACLPFAALLQAFSHQARADTLHITSPVEQVNVVELFTSHGCNSCPPADAWLRKLVDHPDLWREVIPLSFHVDYWDYLGWHDRFADPAYSQRQRAYQRSGGLRNVYTPGFTLNGKEWRGWIRSNSPEFEPGMTVGELGLHIEPGMTATLEFLPGKNLDGLTAHLAVLGFGIASPIGAGENKGKTLKEDFVVLGTSRQMGNGPWQLDWPELRQAETSRLAVVAWVSRAGNPRPLQAVGGWLPDNQQP